MIFRETPLAGAFLVELEPREDERGFFARVFCEREFTEQGLSARFVQVNDSLARAAGTLRGMHYQLPPHAETKLVRCLRGTLFDVIVDLRPGSRTFRRHFGVRLDAETRSMLYVPRGFAHGFVTLEPDTEALYFVDAFYAPEAERGMRWDDPALGIEWPLEPRVISEKDRTHPDFDAAFHLGG